MPTPSSPIAPEERRFGGGAHLSVQIPLLLCIVAAFATLSWFGQYRLGMTWDEKVDLGIARALLRHPLYGSGQDGTQTRLPMYVTAAIFAITSPSLQHARAVGIAIGCGAILAAFVLARRLFDGWTAVLAAVLLGFSPYFLAFARIAMTEGDVFPAMFVTLACWTYARHASRPTGPRLAASAMALGLAVGAKLYALFLIPVLILCEVTGTFRDCSGPSAAQDRDGDMEEGERPSRPLALAIGSVCLAGIAATLSQLRWVVASIAFWALLCVLTIATLVELCRRRRWRPTPGAGLLLIVLLSAAFTCAAMPEHILNPDMLRTTVRRMVRWDHQTPGSLWHEDLRLYSGILLIKGTIPVGIATVAALVWAWVRQRRRPELRLPLFAVSLFVLCIFALPLRQTFYLMNVYPLIAILTAAWLTAARRFLAERWPTAGRFGSFAIGAIVVQLIFVSLLAWPDYNLYGWRLIGTRWLGAEARGYRNLIQTPCDGYAELVDWCLVNVRPGQRVVSYLWADHVLDDLLPARLPFQLTRRGLFEAADRNLPAPPPPPLDQADYVLLHINNFVEDKDAPPLDVLKKCFGGRPIYVVYRDREFPYRDPGFPIAMVYARRAR